MLRLIFNSSRIEFRVFVGAVWYLVVFVCSHVLEKHACMHTCMRWNNHTRKHAWQTAVHSYRYAPAYARTSMHLSIGTYMHGQRRAYKYAPRYIYAHDIHCCLRACELADLLAHPLLTCMHACGRPPNHTHARAHTHTRTIHTRMPVYT